MLDDKKDGGSGGNPYVTLGFCNERFNRMMDKLGTMDDKLDVLNNMYKLDKKELKEERKEQREEHKEKGRDLRLFWLGIVGTGIGAAITYIITKILP